MKLTKKKIIFIILFFIAIWLMIIPNSTFAAKLYCTTKSHKLCYANNSRAIPGIYHQMLKNPNKWLKATIPNKELGKFDGDSGATPPKTNGWSGDMIDNKGCVCFGHQYTSMTPKGYKVSEVITVDEDSNKERQWLAYAVYMSWHTGETTASESPYKWNIINWLATYRKRYNQTSTSCVPYTTTFKEGDAEKYAAAITEQKFTTTSTETGKNAKQHITYKKIKNENYTFIGPYNLQFEYGTMNDKAIVTKGNGKTKETTMYSTDGSTIKKLKDLAEYKGDNFYIVVKGTLDSVKGIKLTKTMTVYEARLVPCEVLATNGQFIGIFYGRKKDKDVNLNLPGIPYSNIEITKKDSDSDGVLQNVKFIVYAHEQKGWVIDNGTSAATYDLDMNKATIYTTDASGKVTVNKLNRAGKYTIYEIENPNARYLHPTIDTKIEMGTVDITLGNTSKIELKNETQTGNLKIIKEDSKNEKIKLKGVGFKIKYSKGYLKIPNVTQAEGTTYFSSEPQYTQDEAEATEFLTDENGIVQVQNIMKGQYTITETSVGNNPGYELDPELVTWSTGAEGLTATVEVTRQKSDQTAQKSDNPSATTVTVKNEKGFIDISGYVWEDLVGGKANDDNPLYNGDKDDVNDKLLQGVKVELVNQETGEIQEKLTDKNGTYKFEKVRVKDLPNLYIRFHYNGMCYENVEIRKEDSKGSKAGEGTARPEFNNLYSTIEGNTENTGVALNEKGEKTDLFYKKTTEDKSEISYRQDKDESKYNFGYEENKDSKCPVNGVDDQYMISATTQNAYDGGNLDKIESADGTGNLTNINLGIKKRAQPDITLGKDLHNVKMTINGYGHTYFYSKRFDANPDYTEDFNLGVKFKNKWTGTYTREIYQSDFDYTSEDKSRELKVYITYELKMIQANNKLKARVNSIVDYYDANYELVKIGSSIDAESGEITNDIKTTDQGVTGKYKKVLIENNTELEPNKETSIYVQFAMNKDAIGKVLDVEGENLDNMAEINSYSIFDVETEKVHAGIDIDSNPGNAKPRESVDYEEKTYEDDTSVSPGLQLKTRDARKLTGKVFIDEARGGPTLQINQERRGDGEYNGDLSKEPGVEGVTITFKDEETGKSCTAETNGEGDFEIKDYIPGEYTLTYTWGGQTYTRNSKKETITVANYKSTIYKEERLSDGLEWYKKDVDTRYSDAMDDWERRLEIDKEISNITTSDTMDATTPNKMKIRVECQDEKSSIIGGIDYQSGDEADYSKDKYQYIIKHVDFGIIERARQEIALDKRVKSFKLTLTNGQTIADVEVKKDVNGNRYIDGERAGVTYMPPDKKTKNNGFIKLELDNELIQGSRLEVTYGIEVTNQSELDYISENYYRYGNVGGERVSVIPSRIIDYLDDKWAFEETDKWKIKKLMDVKHLLKDDVYKDRQSKMDERKILLTEELASGGLIPGQPKELEDIKVSKILTSTDEIALENETEIVEINRTNDYGTLSKSTPGNYIPGKDKFVEPDDSMAETVNVTPATGANYNLVVPILIGITACIILGAGVVLIKKMVL